MESGKIFFHDLRMLAGNRKASDYVSQFDTEKDVIGSETCTVSLGKDHILSLDMCQPHNERESDVYKHGIRQSFVAFAADALELLVV